MASSSVPNELADLLRLARDRGGRAIQIVGVPPSVRIGRDEQWSAPEPFAGAPAIVAFLDEAVIGPQLLEQAVRDQVAAGLRAMGHAIEDEPVASHSATLTIDGEPVAVQATRLASGALLVVPMRWDDVPPLPEVVPEAARAALDGLLGRPWGLVVVTGDDARTRRGLVRSMVRALGPASRILFYITDEDEPALPSVRHRPGSLASRANRVREALRWDPDILVIAPGELGHTLCELAVHAALTGHLTVLELAAADEDTMLAALVATGIDRTVLAPALAGIVGAPTGAPPRVRILDDAARAQLQA